MLYGWRGKVANVEVLYLYEEQLAELRCIARMLGAKKCTIEIKENEKESSKTRKQMVCA